MPLWTPLVPASALPVATTAIEAAILDFKAKQDPKKSFEPAKDVAAFANHFGGTLLIGAAHLGGVVTYLPMSVADAEAVQKCYSVAVKTRCSPRPQFDFAQFDVRGGVVLAVNVWPSVTQLISVKAHADRKSNDGEVKLSEGYGGPAWVFPVRVGNQSIYVEPENLAMYMLPEIRRKALLLHAIPLGMLVTITVRLTNGQLSEYSANYHLNRIDEAANLVVFESGGNKTHYPIDQLETVYEQQDGRWRVRFGIVA